jgi:hypothetical protein
LSILIRLSFSHFSAPWAQLPSMKSHENPYYGSSPLTAVSAASALSAASCYNQYNTASASHYDGTASSPQSPLVSAAATTSALAPAYNQYSFQFGEAITTDFNTVENSTKWFFAGAPTFSSSAGSAFTGCGGSSSPYSTSLAPPTSMKRWDESSSSAANSSALAMAAAAAVSAGGQSAASMPSSEAAAAAVYYQNSWSTPLAAAAAAAASQDYMLS